MNVIEFKRVTKSLGVRFKIDIDNFYVPQGSITGILGGVGSGKTSIMKLILDMIFPDEGGINVLGKYIRKGAILVKGDIGFVGQTNGFLTDASLKSIKSMIKPFYKSWNNQIYKDTLEYFSLNENSIFKTLTVGMQRQFALTLALSHNPQLLLLDDFSRDAFFEETDKIKNMIKLWQKKTGASVFFTTSRVSDILDLATHVGLVDFGRMPIFGEKDDFTDGYTLVEAPREKLSHANDYFINIMEKDGVCQGLTNQYAKVYEIMGEGIQRKTPSIEDIFVYYADTEYEIKERGSVDE